MKKWQKIVGTVSLAILAIINFVIYGLSDMQTIYKGHPSVERVLSDSHDALLNIGYLVLANYLIIVFLFICLWRKGTNKTIPSLIKIISVEKITLPFTFEKTYCRLGVFTENNGIERMEAYFVRNDKTAICYKNSLFYQVVIDDAKHDKYDNSEINTGTIINIRTTTGLANYIVKLSDERLIVFEILPEGYGELYENFTIVLPSDDRYSEYLEDYNKGTELDYLTENKR